MDDKFERALKWLVECGVKNEKFALKYAAEGRYADALECSTLADAYNYAFIQFKKWDLPPPKMVECAMYGCKELKSENASMCNSCMGEYREDPDAFK